jgi:hypothetical protein
MAEARRRFDPEFRAGAVRIVRETGKSIAQVARALGINDGTLAPPLVDVLMNAAIGDYIRWRNHPRTAEVRIRHRIQDLPPGLPVQGELQSLADGHRRWGNGSCCPSDTLFPHEA